MHIAQKKNGICLFSEHIYMLSKYARQPVHQIIDKYEYKSASQILNTCSKPVIYVKYFRSLSKRTYYKKRTNFKTCLYVIYIKITYFSLIIGGSGWIL